MVKKQTTVNIDSEVIKEAKRLGFNMSAVAEKALRDKSGKKQVEIDSNVLNCEVCGREGEKETSEDIRKHRHYSKSKKLTWLYPDEIWVCNTCLRGESLKRASASRAA